VYYEVQAKTRFGSNNEWLGLRQCDAVSTQEVAGGFDLDGAADDSALLALGLNDGDGVFGFEIILNPLQGTTGEFDLRAVTQSGWVRHISSSECWADSV